MYPEIVIREFHDTHWHVGNKIYDPDGELILHVYDFDALLEAGTPSECEASWIAQNHTMYDFDYSEANIVKYQPLMNEFIEKGNIPVED